MRTTLDLDETVLSAARPLATSRGVSLGRAVSDLALKGLLPDAGGNAGLADVAYSSFPVIVGDILVTDEMIAEHRDD